jgi:hypothetical protein
MERTVEECEQFAERTGFACRVAGHFPEAPLPPAPAFVLPPPGRVADRVSLFTPRASGGMGTHVGTRHCAVCGERGHNRTTCPIIKVCGCGRQYSKSNWEELPLCGVTDDGVERIELRQCVCESTIAIVLGPRLA